jgi:membrane protease YdiL (CAAX protease family)
MNRGETSAAKVCGCAFLVIIPLVAAAWLTPQVPHLLRQGLLFVWGVGATLAAERMLFSGTFGQALRAVGFVRARTSALIAASLVSLPMWAFLPLVAWMNGIAVEMRADWPALLVGVVLVNGITEEVIHRGFVFGHLRRGRSFVRAATFSAMLFAAQHLYIIVTTGWMIGLSSVLLAALLAYPMAFVFERGGNSIAGPAIQHTSSNAPAIILALPESFVGTPLVIHMGVVLLSLYGVFIVYRFVVEEPPPSVGSGVSQFK